MIYLKMDSSACALGDRTAMTHALNNYRRMSLRMRRRENLSRCFMTTPLRRSPNVIRTQINSNSSFLSSQSLTASLT
jgi:hypothetical protein